MNLPRILSTACLALWCTSFATAQDDRAVTTPTGTYWNTGQTPAQLTQLQQSGWRFTDLELESSLTGTYTVAAVPNSGSYAKTWWWYDNVSPTILSRALTRNNARLIDLEVYELNGQVRMSGIAISNTGADATGWWWLYDQTASQLNTFISQNNARLLQLERYTLGGNTRYAAVLIPNTGSNQLSWGYFYGATLNTIDNYIRQQGMRIYDIERVGSDSYDAIVVAQPVNKCWRYISLTASEVTEGLSQNKARLIDIERNGSRFDCVMIDNANDLERRAREYLRVSELGTAGVYLKEIGGPILAAIKHQFTFEPAETLTTLHLVHAMNEVRLGSIALNQSIPVDTGRVGSCPNGGGTIVFEPLETSLRGMMEFGDPVRAAAIERRFGRGNINTTAAFLGLTSTRLNNTIGCNGPTLNELSLEDLGDLHENVALGGLSVLREDLYDIMRGTGSFPTWGIRSLRSLISGEATRLGLSRSVENFFVDQVVVAHMYGNYLIGGFGYQSEGGFLRVPFMTAQGTIVDREYAFGAFKDRALGVLQSQEATSGAALEVVWDRVRAALQSWAANGASASAVPYGQGCPSSAGPMLFTTDLPRSGTSPMFELTGAPANVPTFTCIGASRSTWNGLPLPLDLALIGAPNCELLVSPDAQLIGATDAQGVSRTSLGLPPDPTILGGELFVQYLVLDMPANALGLVTSNAMALRVGY